MNQMLAANNIEKPKWAVVLCGGRGTRLGKLTHEMPKPLIPVDGKPILDYIFKGLIKYGFNRLILPVGYLGEKITEFAQSYPFPEGTKCYVQDTGLDTPIGSRLAQIRHLLPDGEDFLLANGDLIFDFDFEEFLKHHNRKKNIITFASATINSPFGLLIHRDGALTGFTRDERIQSFNTIQGHEIGLIYSGICIVNKKGLDYGDISSCDNFEAEIFPEIIKEGQAGYFAIDGFWHPVDTPKDLKSINLILKHKRGANG